MAERYDYYRSNNDRDRDRDRDRDVYLDNRTGVGASQGRGYRADYGSDRSYGRAYGEEDQRERDRNRGYSSYGERQESRSFRPEDYNADYSQGRYGNENYGASSYQTGANRPRPESYGDYYGRSTTSQYDQRQYDDGSLNRMFQGDDQGYAAFGPSAPQRDTRARYGADRDREEAGRRHERGFWDRAGDTVASWFGDDDARRRHEADERSSHRGKGPKGYKRSDTRIQEDLSERLSDDLWLDASHIEVTVKDSEITLSGTVGSRDDRRYAERIAESISGATHVQNNLRVDANGGRDASTLVRGDDVLNRQAQGKS